MAQLRDAQTSELIAVGTPLELVLMAEELGRGEVLFDDVGLNFDPDAVLAYERERLEGLAAAKGEAKGAERKRLAEHHAAATAELELDGSRLEQAAAALERARERVEG